MRRITEEFTHMEMIDSPLDKAGWYLCDHTKVNTKIPVDGYDVKPWNGVTDYCMYRKNGEVLAAVVRLSIPFGAYGGRVPFEDESQLDKSFQLNLFAKKEKQP